MSKWQLYPYIISYPFILNFKLNDSYKIGCLQRHIYILLSLQAHRYMYLKGFKHVEPNISQIHNKKIYDQINNYNFNATTL